MSVLVDSVAKAVELLDKDYPNWFLAIDTEDLWMDSPQKCILGQLYGGYCKGTKRLIGEDYTAPLGWPFVTWNLKGNLPTENKAEWLKVIAARREAFLKQSAPTKKEHA